MKDKLTNFIKQTIKKYNYKGAIIGISGGIDSAVVGALCVEALGRENIFGLLLPERDSSKNTINDSKLVCDFLKIDYTLKKIDPVLKTMGVYSLQPSSLFIPEKIKEKYVKNKWKVLSSNDTFLDDLNNNGNKEFLRGIAYYRAKHRIRMCCLYMEAEKRNYAVIGTTNKTEFETGFYVKWGDDATDIEPLLNLYKTEVYSLAVKLNIPQKIIKKAPTPDLIPGITDEYALGLSYEELDRILKKINSGLSLRDEDFNKVKRVKDIIKASSKRNIRMVKPNL